MLTLVCNSMSRHVQVLCLVSGNQSMFLVVDCLASLLHAVRISETDLFRQFHVQLQIKLAVLPSCSILTPGQPILTLALQQQKPGTMVSRVPVVKSLV